MLWNPYERCTLSGWLRSMICPWLYAAGNMYQSGTPSLVHMVVWYLRIWSCLISVWCLTALAAMGIVEKLALLRYRWSQLETRMVDLLEYYSRQPPLDQYVLPNLHEIIRSGRWGEMVDYMLSYVIYWYIQLKPSSCYLAPPKGAGDFLAYFHSSEEVHHTPIKANDFVFLQDNSMNPCQITVKVDLTKPITLSGLEYLRSQWEEGNPKLSCRAGWSAGRPVWLRNDNSITTNTSVGWYSQSQLLNCPPIRKTEKLFRAYLVASESYPRSTRVFFQFHHSLGDGAALLASAQRTLLRLPDHSVCDDELCLPSSNTTTTSTSERSASIDSSERRFDKITHENDKSNEYDRTTNGYRRDGSSINWMKILETISIWMNTFQTLLFLLPGYTFFWLFWAPTPPALCRNPKTSELESRKPLTGRKLAITGHLELKRFKETCRRTTAVLGDRKKVTVNDLLCTLWAATIHKLRTEVNPSLSTTFEPERNNSNTSTYQPSKLPPISYRHAYASKFEEYLQLNIPLSTRRDAPTLLDNDIMCAFVRIPLKSLSGDPVAHVSDVKEELDWLKKINARLLIKLCFQAVYSVLPLWLTSYLSARITRPCQICISNVRGPKELGSLKEHGDIANIEVVASVRNDTSTTILALSLGEKLQLSLLLDACEYVDEIEYKVKGCFRASYEELLNALNYYEDSAAAAATIMKSNVPRSSAAEDIRSGEVTTTAAQTVGSIEETPSVSSTGRYRHSWLVTHRVRS